MHRFVHLFLAFHLLSADVSQDNLPLLVGRLWLALFLATLKVCRRFATVIRYSIESGFATKLRTTTRLLQIVVHIMSQSLAINFQLSLESSRQSNNRDSGTIFSLESDSWDSSSQTLVQSTVGRLEQLFCQLRVIRFPEFRDNLVRARFESVTGANICSKKEVSARHSGTSYCIAGLLNVTRSPHSITESVNFFCSDKSQFFFELCHLCKIHSGPGRINYFAKKYCVVFNLLVWFATTKKYANNSAIAVTTQFFGFPLL